MTRYIQVAPSVTVSQHPDGNTNAVIVYGSTRAMVIDCQFLPSDGEALLKKAVELSGREAGFLLLTHSHLDHIGGSASFGCPIVASATAASMVRDLWTSLRRENLVKRDARYASLEVKNPDLVFQQKLEIDLGGETAEITVTGGHLPGHAVVYLRSSGVLVAADLVFGNQPLYLGYGEPLQYLKSLKLLGDLPLSAVVPGHGNPGGRELIDKTVSSIQSFVENVKGLAEGGRDARTVAVELAGLLEIPDGYLGALTGNVERLMKALAD